VDKIILCFKCPDAQYYAIKNYVENLKLTDIENGCERKTSEYADIVEDTIHKLNKWIKWGEIVTIEVDLDNDTVRVCNVGRE
jgi:hypothetical protein